ncbi:hypothetical protein J4427_00480 [Candidatus Woesearchaeota archaeon]|nr:hypothetical protein [Candidatus Woesearchaeota archaeon]
MSLDEKVIKLINLMHEECCGNAREVKRRLEEMGIDISSSAIRSNWIANGYEPSPHGGKRNLAATKRRELTESDIGIIKKYLDRYEGFTAKDIKERIKLGENMSYKVAEIVRIRDENYPSKGVLQSLDQNENFTC